MLYRLVLQWFELGGHRALGKNLYGHLKTCWFSLRVPGGSRQTFNHSESLCWKAAISPCNKPCSQWRPTVPKRVQSTAMKSLTLTGEVAKNVTQTLRREILTNIAYSAQNPCKAHEFSFQLSSNASFSNASHVFSYSWFSLSLTYQTIS